VPPNKLQTNEIGVLDMSDTRPYWSYELVDSEAVNDQNNAAAVLDLQAFNDAIETLEDFKKKLADAQGQSATDLEVIKSKVAQVRNMNEIMRIVIVPPEQIKLHELITALKNLRAKVVYDVKEKGFLVEKAKNIAASASALTLDLVNPDLDIDQKHLAIKQFQQVAYPISKTHLALSMLVGAVVGAAVTFLLFFFPELILGAKLLTLLASTGGIIMSSFGAASGLFLVALFSSFKNTEAFDVVEKALNFAPKPGFFGSSVVGLLFQKASKPQEDSASVQQNPQPLRVGNAN
jgi:hypothetical protein